MPLNAAKKIILFTWLLLLAGLANVSAATPGAAQTCAWEKSSPTAETRQAGPQQTAGRHWENGSAAYDFASDSLLAAEGTAYRAINPAFADATEASGQFYRSGAAGRLGNDGIYANSTVEGAISEFQYHNPGVDPAVFRVQYPTGPTLNISPPSGYFSSPLPFTGDANILTAPSLRAPGTVNFLIREGAVPAGRIQ